MIYLGAGLIAAAIGLAVFLTLSYKPEAKDLVLQEKMQGSMAASAVGVADNLLSKKMRDNISLRLSVANLKLRPAEWTTLKSVVGVAFGAVGMLLGGFLLGLVFCGLGLLVTTLWLRLRVKRVRRRFEETLADTLQIIAGGLRSGLSFSAALQVVASDGQDPFKSEIQRVLAKERLGVSLDDGLEEIAARMQSKAFQWVALAVRVQKEVGGNLSEILTTTTETLRERAYLIRQINTLSAEGRFSSYILLGLPFAVAGILLVIRPEYMQPLWQTPIGLTSCIVAAVMMTIGVIWMRAVVKVDV